MKRSLKKSLFTALSQMALACCLTQCVSTEPGYDEALRMARTDCADHEVVGIWRIKEGGTDKSEILLFRPDGTGRDRVKLPNGSVEERTLVWHYQGRGEWTTEETGAAIAQPGAAPDKASRDGWRMSLTVHLSGSMLLCELRRDERRNKPNATFSSMMFGAGGTMVAGAASRIHGGAERRIFVREG